ncbi:phosphatase PAP2 family protein [Ferruginibacter paludis]|uniref:phosphatase PAP2 family protein n=1 Tax=Ferruginibacter paludis TaxID=1310417 RepID=UPI0025B49B0C|nr:phosphatase PAP2 family protein [Ferruginibacter paludis]MDN3656719.1 phosphatase PAP2 family protein [Ferruginibacter paludis]
MKRRPDVCSCSWYFCSVLLMTFISGLMLMAHGKSACFISLNNYHPFWLNVFFINYTFVGDGIFAFCLIAIAWLFFKRKEEGKALLISFILSGLATQIIKNLVNAPRPKLYFEAGQYLHFIDGVSLANNSSFPSGHTATAFALATVLVLMARNKNAQLVVLLAAATVGYSRIYLAQHFLLDVMIGAVIGTASGILAVYFALNLNALKLPAIKWHPAKNNNRQSGSPSSIQTA